MARAERDALTSLGLDAGAGAFALDADRLREHLDALRAPVGQLTAALDLVAARLDEVQRDAVAAVETAHLQVGAADAARVAAEQQRDEAVLRARRSAEVAEQAGEQRAEALTRATAAARQALDATEALGAARQGAEQAVRARDVAVGRAAEMEARAVAGEASARDHAIAAEHARAECGLAEARTAGLREALEDRKSVV